MKKLLVSLVLYLPVIHQGHLKLFAKYRGADLYILDLTLVKKLKQPEEIRAVDPSEIRKMVKALGFFNQVELLSERNVADLKGTKIILGQDQVSEQLAEKYFRRQKVTFEQVFLRWDEGNVKSSHPIQYDRVATDKFAQMMVGKAYLEGDKSSDWWRQVGALAVKDGIVLISAHNSHLPTENNQYVDGDPRDFIASGTMGEISGAIHAEEAIVGEVARLGMSLDGAEVYMNVFPCVRCARTLAAAGVKAVYFRTGNTYLHVEEELKAKGVEIVLVK